MEKEAGIITDPIKIRRILDLFDYEVKDDRVYYINYSPIPIIENDSIKGFLFYDKYSLCTYPATITWFRDYIKYNSNDLKFFSQYVSVDINLISEIVMDNVFKDKIYCFRFKDIINDSYFRVESLRLWRRDTGGRD